MSDERSGVATLEQRAVDALCDLAHPTKVAARDWAEEHLGGRDLVAADRDSVFDEEGWRRCAEQGIHGLLVPAELGGTGGDLVTALLTLEGLGAGCRDLGLLYAVASQMLSTQVALLHAGSEEQKRRWLPPLCRGDAIGAFAITEPGAGSDTEHIEARAERLEDGSYRIDAHKAFITLAPRADMVIVFASTDPSAGGWGISAFVVPTDLEGVRRTANREKMGLRTTPFGDVHLDGVLVPESARLGPEGAGSSILRDAMDAERSFLFAPQIGALERQLEDCIAYARQRRVGDRPIGDRQAISHRIADMKLRHESMRLFLYKAALHSIRGEPGAMAAALSKLASSEGAVESTLAATQIYGARGFVSEFEVDRAARDAVGGLSYSGTSDIQRNIVARLLGATKGTT
jgi:alkylation response protein AidB-like acyl-CoA dehydrogenase